MTTWCQYCENSQSVNDTFILWKVKFNTIVQLIINQCVSIHASNKIIQKMPLLCQMRRQKRSSHHMTLRYSVTVITQVIQRSFYENQVNTYICIFIFKNSMCRDQKNNSHTLFTFKPTVKEWDPIHNKIVPLTPYQPVILKQSRISPNTQHNCPTDITSTMILRQEHCSGTMHEHVLCCRKLQEVGDISSIRVYRRTDNFLVARLWCGPHPAAMCERTYLRLYRGSQSPVKRLFFHRFTYGNLVTTYFVMPIEFKLLLSQQCQHLRAKPRPSQGPHWKCSSHVTACVMMMEKNVNRSNSSVMVPYC